MDYGFVKQIEQIRESKNGFAALMFCLKHYGFDEVYEAMQKIFEYDANRYAQIIGKLADFRGKIVGEKSPKPIKNKSSKWRMADREPDVTGLTLIRQRKYVPGQALDMRAEPEVLAVYAPNANGGPVLLEMIGLGFERLPLGRFEPLSQWSGTTRGIWSGTARQLRKEYVVTIKNEGVARLASMYQ